MKQTSTSMLESWRANCDVAIIVYDADPSEFSARDVATISGYVVSYTCKDGVSYQSEHKQKSSISSRSNEATKQRSNEATKQRSNEATKQRSNEATKQRSNEATKHLSI